MTVLVMTLRADSGYSLSPGQCYRSGGIAGNNKRHECRGRI
ncbi:MAG: hypothetical protein K0Q52_1503 [Microbacterium sp.]|jgi:hypothetical protein|nr:hypothetical protein [Microbacterium sp.]